MYAHSAKYVMGRNCKQCLFAHVLVLGGGSSHTCLRAARIRPIMACNTV